MYKIAVFTSGMSRGSNYEAIYNYFALNKLPVTIAFVLVTTLKAPILEKCAAHRTDVLFLPLREEGYIDKLSYELQKRKIDLVALSGYLKKIPQTLLAGLDMPFLNIHPALLPKYGGEGFYGQYVHEAVFAAGEKTSGASVHYVNGQYDAGEILAQEEISIEDCASPAEIAKKVLAIEHALYGKTIWRVLQQIEKV